MVVPTEGERERIETAWGASGVDVVLDSDDPVWLATLVDVDPEDLPRLARDAPVCRRR